MADEHVVSTPRGVVHVVSTNRHDGDFAVSLAEPVFGRVRSTIAPLPWTWLQQVHGAEVVVATSPGDGAGTVADAVVTELAGAPIAVTTADCAPLVLVGTSAIGVVHAGWKGIMAGVIEATSGQLRALGSEPLEVICGPCIQPGAYEFGSETLDEIEQRFGPGIRASTDGGRPALDMTATVAAACEAAGWPVPSRPACTSAAEFFSHRTRGDRGRQTTVAWIEPA